MHALTLPISWRASCDVAVFAVCCSSACFRSQVQIRSFVRVRPHGVGAPWDHPQVRFRGPKQARKIGTNCRRNYRGKRGVGRGFLVLEGGTY